MPPHFSQRVIHLNSKYATSSTTNTYSFQLSKPITIPQEYSLVASVISATIPSSFYAFPNPITLQYTINGTTTNWVYNSQPYTIPAGNWTIIEVANFLNTGSSGTTSANLASIITAGTTNVNVNYVPDMNVFSFTKAGANTVVIPSQATTYLNSILGISSSITLGVNTVYGNFAPQKNWSSLCKCVILSRN